MTQLCLWKTTGLCWKYLSIRTILERITGPEAKGLRHIAFCVDSLDDLKLPCEEIRTDWFGRRFTFIKDPDGQPIELKEKNQRSAAE